MAQEVQASLPALATIKGATLNGPKIYYSGLVPINCPCRSIIVQTGIPIASNGNSTAEVVGLSDGTELYRGVASTTVEYGAPLYNTMGQGIWNGGTTIPKYNFSSSDMINEVRAINVGTSHAAGVVSLTLPDDVCASVDTSGAREIYSIDSVTNDTHTYIPTLGIVGLSATLYTRRDLTYNGVLYHGGNPGTVVVTGDVKTSIKVAPNGGDTIKTTIYTKVPVRAYTSILSNFDALNSENNGIDPTAGEVPLLSGVHWQVLNAVKTEVYSPVTGEVKTTWEGQYAEMNPDFYGVLRESYREIYRFYTSPLGTYVDVYDALVQAAGDSLRGALSSAVREQNRLIRCSTGRIEMLRQGILPTEFERRMRDAHPKSYGVSRKYPMRVVENSFNLVNRISVFPNDPDNKGRVETYGYTRTVKLVYTNSKGVEVTETFTGSMTVVATYHTLEGSSSEVVSYAITVDNYPLLTQYATGTTYDGYSVGEGLSRTIYDWDIQLWESYLLYASDYTYFPDALFIDAAGEYLNTSGARANMFCLVTGDVLWGGYQVHSAEGYVTVSNNPHYGFEGTPPLVTSSHSVKAITPKYLLDYFKESPVIQGSAVETTTREATASEQYSPPTAIRWEKVVQKTVVTVTEDTGATPDISPPEVTPYTPPKLGEEVEPPLVIAAAPHTSISHLDLATPNEGVKYASSYSVPITYPFTVSDSVVTYNGSPGASIKVIRTAKEIVGVVVGQTPIGDEYSRVLTTTTTTIREIKSVTKEGKVTETISTLVVPSFDWLDSRLLHGEVVSVIPLNWWGNSIDTNTIINKGMWPHVTSRLQQRYYDSVSPAGVARFKYDYYSGEFTFLDWGEFVGGKLAALVEGKKSPTEVTYSVPREYGTTPAEYHLLVDTTYPTLNYKVTITHAMISNPDWPRKANQESTIRMGDGGRVTLFSPTLVGTVTPALQAGDRIVVYANGRALGTATVDGGNWTYEASQGTSEQNYTARVEQLGFISVASNVFTVYHDNSPGGDYDFYPEGQPRITSVEFGGVHLRSGSIISRLDSSLKVKVSAHSYASTTTTTTSTETKTTMITVPPVKGTKTVTTKYAGGNMVTTTTVVEVTHVGSTNNSNTTDRYDTTVTTVTTPVSYVPLSLNGKEVSNVAITRGTGEYVEQGVVRVLDGQATYDKEIDPTTITINGTTHNIAHVRLPVPLAAAFEEGETEQIRPSELNCVFIGSRTKWTDVLARAKAQKQAMKTASFGVEKLYADLEKLIS